MSGDRTMAQTTMLGFLLLALTTTTSAELQNGATQPQPDNFVVAVSETLGSGYNSDRCVCKIMTTDWSELAEYRKLGEMRQKLKVAESLLESMNFSAIFDRLENATARLNDLEADINKQAVSASVTELFALRKNVNSLVDIMESTNMSSLVANQREHLGQELDTIAMAIKQLWERNPYTQRSEYKKQVAELRERFSKCHRGVQLSPFDGDALTLDSSLLKGWCPGDDTEFKLGTPVTQKWIGSDKRKGMWYKDPQPLTNTSRTEVWTIIYETTVAHRHRSNSYYDEGYDITTVSKSMNRFSTFADFVSNNPSPSPISLYDGITGYGAVIFRNALYYTAGSNLVKQDLTTDVKTTVKMGFQHTDYKDSSASTYLDLKIDESGLWVVYSISSDNKIAVSKLDPIALIAQKTWMTGIAKSNVCAAFMMCGKLYTITSCSSRLSPGTANYVYDTVSSKGRWVQYYVPSMYGAIAQLTYNPREKMLFAMDNGHMVTYTMGWKKQWKGEDAERELLRSEA